MKKTIIVMPVANEEKTIRGVLEKILSLPYDHLWVFPVIDAFSHDQTENIIDEIETLSCGRVHKIFYKPGPKDKKGVVACYLYGFKQALLAGAEHIIEMDGGGSHLPEELPSFIEKLNEGYECVWGSRFIKGGDIENHPLYRRLLSWGGTLLANFVLHTKLNDMTSGFEAFQRHVLEKFNFDNFLSTGHMYQTEMRFYCRRYKSVEVPIHYIGSGSTLKSKSVFEALRILFELKKNEARVYDKQA